MKTALLVANHDAFAKQIARWAIVLKRYGEWDPVIYLTQNYLDRHMVACRAAGIRIIRQEESAAVAAPEYEAPAEPRRSFRDVVRRIPLASRLGSFRKHLPSARLWLSTLRRVRRQISVVEKIIAETGAGVLLIAETSPAHGAEVFIAAARHKGIPVVTAPIEKQSGEWEAENYLYAFQLSLGRGINRVAALFGPRWVIRLHGAAILRAPAETIFAFRCAGVEYPRPWSIVDNGEDMIAVDSESTARHYESRGIPAERLAVVGRAEHDIMFEVACHADERRRLLYARLGFRDDKPMLLSPLVPDHYVSGRPECDFQDYGDLVKFWASSLGAITTHNVVINLHPGHTYQRDAADWKYLEEFGAKIAVDDLAELVPLCDVFVAAGYSTTTAWAVTCAKPVLNYDVYRFKMTMYDDVPGVLTVREQDEFIATLRRLTGDRAFHAEVAALQRLKSSEWGKLDGKAAERLSRLFDDLSASHRSRLKAGM